MSILQINGITGILACGLDRKCNAMELKITKRNLPHWTMDGAIYFVTFRTKTGMLSFEEQEIVFRHIKRGNKKFYVLIAVVVMPDHVHLIFRPFKKYTLIRVMKGIKGVSARLINEDRNMRGTVWQDESYDRIIRNEEELQQKIRYMSLNPVKAELVEKPEDYPFWFYNENWIDDLPAEE
jgi:putative transposase